MNKIIGPALFGGKKPDGENYSLTLDTRKILINGRTIQASPIIKENIELIEESIWRILNTERGERVYNRDFGCNLRRYIFEQLDSITLQIVKNDIFTSLTKWEPRAKIVSLDVKSKEQTILVTLEYMMNIEGSVVREILTITGK